MPDRALRAFWILAFGITWGVGGIALIVGHFAPGFPLDAHNPLYFVAAYGPTIAALVVRARAGGGAGVKALLARLIPRAASAPYYAVVVGLPIVAASAAAFTDPKYAAQLPPLGALVAAFPLALLSDAGPQGEELGWRGFALPRILARRGPLGASLVLGVIWAAWHAPTFFIASLSQHALSIPLFVIETVALSMIMTWLFVRTNGDVLLMILVHLASNFSGGALGVPEHVHTGVNAALALLVLASGGLRARAGAK